MGLIYEGCTYEMALVVAARPDSGRVRGRGRPRHTYLLVFVLELIELPVNAALGEQLLVRSHFPHLTFVHNDDLVGALDGREAVGDDQRGAAFDHAAEGVPDAEFGFGVHA